MTFQTLLGNFCSLNMFIKKSPPIPKYLTPCPITLPPGTLIPGRYKTRQLLLNVTQDSQGRPLFYFFDRDGIFQHSFGGGQLFYLRGICVDHRDSILITDGRNNRISIFSSKGVLIQQVPCKNPVAVCSTRRKIYVTKTNDSVNVFSN